MLSVLPIHHKCRCLAIEVGHRRSCVTHSVATISFIFPSRLLSFRTRLFVFFATLLLTVFLLIRISPALAAYNTDALKGFWKLDEGTGTSAADASGDGKTATLTGSPVWTTGKFINGLQFNGSNYATTSVTWTDTGSIVLWAYPTSYTDWISPAGWKLLGATNGYALIDEGGAGSPGRWRGVFRPNNSGNAEAAITASATITQNTWNHLVLTWGLSGTTYTIKFYVNGSLQGTTTWVGTPGAGGRGVFHFGNAGDYPDNYFVGKVDDVRVYNRVLSQTEVTALANSLNTTATWAGGTSTSWETGANWDIGAVPDPYTNIVVAATARSPVVPVAVSGAALTINTGALLQLTGKKFTLNDVGLFTNYGTLAVLGNSTISIAANDTSHGTAMVYGTGSYSGLPLGGTYYNFTINDGLMTYLKFDEKSGTRAADASGYNGSGTLVGGAVPSAVVAPLNFHNPRSLSFDGINDHVTVPAGFSDLHNGITIALWANPSATGNWARFMDFGNGQSSNNILFGRKSSTSDLWFEIYTGATGGGVTATGAISNNQWHHYAATVTAVGGVRLYKDGQLLASGTTNAPVNITRTLNYIGRSNWGVDAYYQGKMDDFRIYNRVLSQGEIAALGAGNQPATASGTLTLGSALTVNNNLTLNSGLLDVSSSNYGITVGGSWLNNGGTFNARNGTVTFGSSSAGLEVLSGGQWFNNMTFGSGGTWNTRDRLTASGTVTFTSGTLDASGSYTVHAGTWYENGGGFSAESGSVVLMSPANSTVTNFSHFNTLHIEDPTESGLIAYWKLDDGQAIIRDSSGYGHTGVRTGTGSTWSGSSLPSLIQFDNAFAMKFNGYNDEIDVPQSSQFELQAFTISAWINLSSAAGDRNAIVTYGQGVNIGGSAATESVAFIYHQTANLLRLRLDNGAGTSFIDLQPNPTSLAGHWSHVVATWDGATAKVYQDGTLIGSQTSADTINYTSNSLSKLRIGTWFGNNERFFNGAMDDVRIYNRALSANEVVNLSRGSYANGALSTALFSLGANLVVNALRIDSGLLSTLDSSVTVIRSVMQLLRGDGSLTVGSGYARLDGGLLLSGAVVNGTAGTVNINGNMLMNTGSFLAPSGTMTVSGNWNRQGGTFTHNSGLVFFNGTNQTLSGSTTFNAFKKTASTSATLTFASGSTQTILGALTLTGASSSALLSLRSGTAGNQWKIDVQGVRNLAYLDVKDSENINAAAMVCYTSAQFCTDSGNNTNWTFSASSTSSSVADQGTTQRGGGGYARYNPSYNIVKAALIRYAQSRQGSQQQTRAAQAFEKVIAENKIAPAVPTPDAIARLPQKDGSLQATVSGERVVFKDVKTKDWFAYFVYKVAEGGIVSGYKSAEGKLTGRYGPANPVLRSELLKMVMEAAKVNLKDHPGTPRNQSARGQWSSAYAKAAEDLGLSVYVPEVDISKPATRGEVVQTVLEALHMPIGNHRADFSDVPLAHPYTNAIGIAAFLGIVSGDADAAGKPTGKFRPEDSITRAEVAKIISLATDLMR